MLDLIGSCKFRGDFKKVIRYIWQAIRKKLLDFGIINNPLESQKGFYYGIFSN